MLKKNLLLSVALLAGLVTAGSVNAVARVGLASADPVAERVVASGAYIASEFGVVHTHMGSAPFHKPTVKVNHPDSIEQGRVANNKRVVGYDTDGTSIVESCSSWMCD